MDLRDMLDAVLASESDHPTRLAKSAAIISEAFRREGLEATVAWYQANEAWWRPQKDATEAKYAQLGR